MTREPEEFIRLYILYKTKDSGMVCEIGGKEDA